MSFSIAIVVSRRVNCDSAVTKYSKVLNSNRTGDFHGRIAQENLRVNHFLSLGCDQHLYSSTQGVCRIVVSPRKLQHSPVWSIPSWQYATVAFSVFTHWQQEFWKGMIHPYQKVHFYNFYVPQIIDIYSYPQILIIDQIIDHRCGITPIARRMRISIRIDNCGLADSYQIDYCTDRQVQ